MVLTRNMTEPNCEAAVNQSQCLVAHDRPVGYQDTHLCLLYAAI